MEGIESIGVDLINTGVPRRVHRAHRVQGIDLDLGLLEGGIIGGIGEPGRYQIGVDMPWLM